MSEPVKNKFKDNEILLERLICFGEEVITLCKILPQNTINIRLIIQLIDCATSIGANYSEACEAESAKDFVHKIKIAKKEAKETRFFLRLLLKANPEFREEIIKLGKISTEFVKIFSSIVARFK